MLRSLVIFLAIPWLILFILFVTFVSVYGDPIAHTEITVERLPTDNREETQAEADLRLAIKDTAIQFGFYTPGPVHPDIVEIVDETPSAHVSLTDLVAGENPSIWLDLSLDESPLVIKLNELYCDLRTSKHRKLADALVTNIRTIGFEAAITLHSPDYSGWGCWIVLLALFVVAVLLLWVRKNGTIASGTISNIGRDN